MTRPKVDADLIAELTAQLTKNDLTELEWSEGDRSIRVVRNSGANPITAQTAPTTLNPEHLAPIPAAAAATVEPGPGDVTSPMVGTVYLAPEPGARPYAQSGDKVIEGQTVLIIEAMKTMNPITAHMSGTIETVLITDGEAVEYGQPLMTIS